MQTQLPKQFTDSTAGAEAERILRSCVHCGFCNATCPTYQLLGDELDGPRGRIYLIKRMLEGESAGAGTRLHLDRCLTCRACETTCPSGVEYGRLLDIGRARMESMAVRPRRERLLRRLLCTVLPFPGRVRVALALSRWFGALLPAALARAVPARLRPERRDAYHWPAPHHARRVLILDGCVQSVTHAHINAAAARLLDRHGVSLVRVTGTGCCGAVTHHLSQDAPTRSFMRRNIDAWWPEVERGAEAIVTTSSACSAMVKDYGHLLRDDPDYADKARRIAALAGDITGVVAGLGLKPRLPAGTPRRVAFHAPCSLQHGLRAHAAVEGLLRGAGYDLTPVADAHLCCGAAGTYSILQAELSGQLLANKLAALEAAAPEVIASANIGCLIHLQGGAQTRVRHWIELIEEAYP
ncbi:MAG: glycolate oxidase subunit GlcF [Gammaproteobacteria bacterium]|nr:glycolate oxidase subunit GlcF [Gammaproteobacteria bacterium]